MLTDLDLRTFTLSGNAKRPTSRPKIRPTSRPISRPTIGGQGGSFCRRCVDVCQGNGGQGGSLGGNGGSGGSIGGNVVRGGKRPSCGSREGRVLQQDGCSYECKGNILGDGKCATERSGTCGSCFGNAWSGGPCRYKKFHLISFGRKETFRSLFRYCQFISNPSLQNC